MIKLINYFCLFLFNFTEKEIRESPKRKLWAKIIPDWSDGYKNLLNFLNSANK